MRFNDMFNDLEAQLAAGLEEAQLLGEVENERLRIAQLGLAGRLAQLKEARAAEGAEARVGCVLCDGQSVRLRLQTVGRDWISGALTDSLPAKSALIALGAISHLELEAVDLHTSLEEPVPGTRLMERLGIVFALRDIARKRTPVLIHVRGGVLTGTIDRVSADHLDIAEHPLDVARRRAQVRSYRLIMLSQLQFVCF